MSESQQKVTTGDDIADGRVQKQVPPLLVIVGQTATGKSSLALDLAERLGGEILCADSRTVYQEMNIGTAKPSAADQARVPHWGLDLATPGERFTVADFKVYAERVIADIQVRGKLPIMVGGSGLYIDAVLYDYQLRPPAEPKLRAELEALTIDELQSRVLAAGLSLPENPRNPRHLVRAIETADMPEGLGGKSGLRANTCVVGLELPIDELEHRIAHRVGQMLADGLVDEARQLAEHYGWEAQAMMSPGYRELRGYIEGTQSLDETAALIIKDTRALAKRQKTWFKRNKSIHWLINRDKLSEAVDIATTVLDT